MFTYNGAVTGGSWDSQLAAKQDANIAATDVELAAEAAARSAADALLIPVAQKGAANGVASLGTGSRVPSTQLPVPALDLREFGATFDGTTDDKSAIDAGIAAVTASGGGRLTGPPGKTLVTSGGHALRRGVWIELPGITNSRIKHTGDNTCFHYTEGPGLSPQGTNGGGLKGFWLTGNAGSSAVGIHVGDAFGCQIEDVVIGGRNTVEQYTTGVAILLQTDTYWTEGTILDGVRSMFNAVGLRFQNNLSAVVGVGNSFGYTKLFDFACQVPASGIGIDIGGPIDNPVLLYHAELTAHLWGAQGESHTNNVCILIRKNAQVVPTTRASIKGEVIGGTGNTWIRNIGDGTTGGKFNPTGHVRVWRDGGCTDDLQAASETLLHQSANTPLALDPSIAVPGAVGCKEAGTGAWRQSHALSGATSKSNEDAWFTGGYSFTGAPIHRFLALAINAHLRGPFNADAATKAWIRADGALCLGTVADPRVIQRGTNTAPEGNVTGTRGDIYIRTTATGASVYVKSQGDATNTGWTAISPLKGTGTWDPASVAAGTVSAAKTVVAVGAAIGDFAQAGFSNVLPAGCFLKAEVTAADTVSVYLVNLSGSAQDVASGTVTVRVSKN